MVIRRKSIVLPTHSIDETGVAVSGLTLLGSLRWQGVHAAVDSVTRLVTDRLGEIALIEAAERAAAEGTASARSRARQATGGPPDSCSLPPSTTNPKVVTGRRPLYPDRVTTAETFDSSLFARLKSVVSAGDVVNTLSNGRPNVIGRID